VASFLDRLLDSGDADKRLDRFFKKAKPFPPPDLRQCRCGAQVSAIAEYCDYCGRHHTDPHKWVPVS
jgi:hypothetical protein